MEYPTTPVHTGTAVPESQAPSGQLSIVELKEPSLPAAIDDNISRCCLCVGCNGDVAEASERYGRPCPNGRWCQMVRARMEPYNIHGRNGGKRSTDTVARGKLATTTSLILTIRGINVYDRQVSGV